MDFILKQIWSKKFSFLGTFFVIFSITYIILVAVDFLPEPKADLVQDVSTESAIEVESDDTEITDSVVIEEDSESSDQIDEITQPAVFPLQIKIDKLGTEVTVNNPTSRNIADLDNSLLSGVVRHPDSATLNQEGNVFILGHSSYLPTVFNKNFQAFNGIQKLGWGDEIEVFSETEVYTYRVENVYRAKAQDVTVPIAGTEKILTLATCNSFGSTDDRYIVEAHQISVKSI